MKDIYSQIFIIQKFKAGNLILQDEMGLNRIYLKLSGTEEVCAKKPQVFNTLLGRASQMMHHWSFGDSLSGGGVEMEPFILTI